MLNTRIGEKWVLSWRNGWKWVERVKIARKNLTEMEKFVWLVKLRVKIASKRNRVNNMSPSPKIKSNLEAQPNFFFITWGILYQNLVKLAKFNDEANRTTNVEVIHIIHIYTQVCNVGIHKFARRLGNNIVYKRYGCAGRREAAFSPWTVNFSRLDKTK